MSGRSDYEERRQARIDRLRDASTSAAERSASAAQRASDLVKDIPFGQPNIIGRPALPRLREKSGQAMSRSIEEGKASEYYAEKAEAAAGNTAISSDDPGAIGKLEAKIAHLEAMRDAVKAANKLAKKNGTEISPWYTLPYLARDIKAAKDRVVKLQRIESMPYEVIEFEGGEIEVDPVTNRVIIRYDQRQSDEITDKLKSRGFKWSPSSEGWQRIRTVSARRNAVELTGAKI